MAVYQRSYRDIETPIISSFDRSLVIARYGMAELFSSRFFLGFFLVSLVPQVVFITLIYLRYNIEALIQLDISLDDILMIDAAFFGQIVQSTFGVIAFAMVLFVGPALVSPDLRNNALPLYLSRPLSKSDYILGKLAVIVLLASAVTWVPGLLLFFAQVFLGEPGWFGAHWHVPIAMAASSFVWIVVLSLVALAISAWVKWKPIARLGFFAVFLIAAAFGNIWREAFDDSRGAYLNPFEAYESFAAWLYGLSMLHEAIPGAHAFVVLVVVAVLALLALRARVTAFEVVS